MTYAYCMYVCTIGNARKSLHLLPTSDFIVLFRSCVELAVLRLYSTGSRPSAHHDLIEIPSSDPADLFWTHQLNRPLLVLLFLICGTGCDAHHDNAISPFSKPTQGHNLFRQGSLV